MIIDLQEIKDSLYTDSMVVITPELIEAWKKDDSLAEYAKHIMLSKRPDIFQKLYNYDDDVVIWRNTLSAPITRFVSETLQKMGDQASRSLRVLWENAGPLKLDNGGKIIGHDNLKIKGKMIIDLYADHGIAPDITKPFAKFYLGSLEKILLNLPSQAKLHATRIDSNCTYARSGKRFMKGHSDGCPTVILHFSDPGTPYVAQDKRTPLYRTRVGDFTVHGSEVTHGFATSKPNRHDFKPRFFSSFMLDYYGS